MTTAPTTPAQPIRPAIEVIKPGALSTFQDLGRAGYQQLGVPANGVMDERAHRLANALVGNPQDTATLEITLMGPTLRFGMATAVAVCGADLDASIDGTPLPIAQACVVPAGATLSFGKRKSGLRAYLAVAGGFALHPVMGSDSTFVRGGYGGMQGKPLRKADVIGLRAPRAGLPDAPAQPSFAAGVMAAPEAPLRVVRGREWDAFSADAHAAFTSAKFRIGAQSDRMGYRLEGPALALSAPREMWSEAVAFGTVQVPPDGQPIVLMADRQTTGGYPKIAHVCAVDLPRLAQRMPGESVRFTVVGLDEAQRLAQLQDTAFAALERDHG
ncbi:biotin-dependent carboxyltransferase family protein [Cupriavidus consociatus]|uniref:5-oxoprolinase subunit C family protein n=1 Tax=Cupriavidus consociatus TaxID=2821357 RepID=UPI001AE6D993|nr:MULTISPECIES: biotin-dependent carboxyltransferase family protein [unclassified Cupriavidus]MBP0625012.1 biotin-dependent carboxyltransferase family protein [Cupriavidus sp. LEh25]MDK2661747.1 biotin-dependent carboxyltransferase family protein [Cupriavidus sp. LEh21]